ncbi:Rv2175c family DNA-binding protein [Corynebacterium sp. UBA2622]|uniref:Rv2175c family DNA-binding protein n=1 Tax=Corynebacterium sp. UBA2622 TaxID=1946393 RepID=UPI0025B8AE95|nr:Rv2175c family DNA-binding protein [Corynebacterium sp. UBA2622]
MSFGDSPATQSTPDLDALLAGEKLLSLPEVAEYLDVPVTRVHDLVGARKLLVYKRGGTKYVPKLLLGDDGGLSKFVSGAITVLHDGGFGDEEILTYLYTPDDSLPGRPIDALHGHGAREVIRRAQAMGF